MTLPVALAPLDLVGGQRFSAYFPQFGAVTGTLADLRSFRRPLEARPGTPLEVVRNCQHAIFAAALPYGVLRVDAASAGDLRRSPDGYRAPVELRVIYRRWHGLETRQATISCSLNEAGRVYAAL
ncbi:MAG TPA: hypothetical protein VHG27_02795 [Xanthobacteraceae bacterium]|nr:hypothetical protein [Xanthobacteraceae bacterium]